jgi:Helix-turn-helix domain
VRKRHPNHRRVKIHRSYTVEEVAELFDTHKNTVRSWIKAGLPTVDSKRPTLILGRDLAAFLQARRASKKQRCQPGELYCVRCRAPRPPAGDMADYQPVTEKFGNLTALCPDCECLMNRRVSLAGLRHVQVKMDIRFPQALRHISESNQPTVNSDLE